MSSCFLRGKNYTHESAINFNIIIFIKHCKIRFIRIVNQSIYIIYLYIDDHVRLRNLKGDKLFESKVCTYNKKKKFSHVSRRIALSVYSRQIAHDG